MRPGPTARLLMRVVHHYQHSNLRRRTSGCCRFSPTCSHYAEDALRTRALPAAIVLVGWRLLRCTPRTPAGTYDPVGPRVRVARRAAAVLTLSGLTLVLVTTTASAVDSMRPSGLPSDAFSGGCQGTVGGRQIGQLTRDHPLQVHKGQAVVVQGTGPTARVAPGSEARLASHTDVSVYYIEKVGSTHFNEDGHGLQFGKSVRVDQYLRYGSGLYRVDVHSVAGSAWDCLATFYAELHGSKLAAEAAITVGSLGVLGVAAAGGGGGEPEPEQPPHTPNLGDEDATEEAPPVPTKDTAANVGAIAGIGCLMAGLLGIMDASDGGWLAVLPLAAARPTRRVWVRGRPVLGVISGLFAGLGAAVAMQQFGQWTLNPTTVFILPGLFAVLGGVRGWRGRAWRV